MIHSLKKAAYKHGYLVITAAWLYTISFIFINYWSYHSSPQKVQNKLENRLHRLENNVADWLSDTAKLASLIEPGPRPDNIPETEAGLFIYGQGKLLFWNTNRMYLNTADMFRKDGVWFTENQNGAFEMIRRTLQVRGRSITAFALIPVRWAYFIENKYLHTDFAGYDGLDEQYQISKELKALPVRNAEGQELFRIELKPGKSFISYDIVTIILRVLAIILLLIFLHSVAIDLIGIYRFHTGFYFLLGTVLFLRLIAYRFPFPFDFSKLPLFDPAVYASNFLHPSLGDLLVNAVLLFWLVNFYKNHSGGQPLIRVGISKSFSDYAGLFLFSLSGFLLAGIFVSLVQDSKISFDVTNFFSLTIYSVTSFVILCLLVLSFYHFSQIVLRGVIVNKIPVARQCLSVVLYGFGFLILRYGSSDVPLYLCIILWLLAYLCLLNFRKKDIDIPLLRSSFFIFWVMLFALSIAGIVIYENRIVESEQRKRIAEKLALQTDPSGENMLNIAATNLDTGFLAAHFHRLSASEYANKFFKDSLIKQNFSGYLNKYDTRIYSFDRNHHPLYNEDSLSFAALSTIILNQAKATVIPDWYSYENATEGFSYIYPRVIKNGADTLGYLFVTIKSKRYKSEALYPELFNQVQDIASDLNTNYAYAVYNKGKIINHFNTYSFPSLLNKEEVPVFEFAFRQNGRYSELWYNNGDNKQVLVVKRSAWLMESLTLFAYLFCSFLCIMLIFHLAGLLLQTHFNWIGLKQLLRLNIRTQIQATIIFLSVFSFIVIGIATISFFIIRFHNNNEERLSKSIQVMANEVNNRMNSLAAFDDLPDNIGIRTKLEKTIAEISDLHNVDINYYDVNGNLLISTQPYIYNKHLLSSLMEPNAYRQLQAGHSIHYLQSEKVGELEYLSIYVPLSNEQGTNYAYLNIPYLNSQNELNQEISGFLATLINLNAFIFLIAGAIAFFLTSRITASFSLIGKKMQEMNLGQINEAIEWNRNDEIGLLVDEYNKMVKKLEASAHALAQSEREGAWREMARQVAHEIKNPLTPMKLSIQYLQNAIEKGAPNVKELSANMAVTLVEQIDQLSKIAGDFSQFANIGNARIERFDMSTVLASLVSLYSSNPDVQLEWHKEEGSYFIISDKVQINRLFTNLLQNAVEAGEGMKKKLHIRIDQKVQNGKILITVQDNAGGIPENMKENIFTPNFTTKSSGTGLGLAICKGIAEQANGQIWFSSEEGVGTTFFIELPGE